MEFGGEEGGGGIGLVVFAITQVLHQFSGSVADVKGNREVAVAFNVIKRCKIRIVGGAVFGCFGQITHHMGKGDLDFRQANSFGCSKRFVGQGKSVGVAQANIFAGKHHHSTGNEAGIFARFDHTSQVVERCVGLTGSHGLNKSRNGVVVLVALSVEAKSGRAYNLFQNRFADWFGALLVVAKFLKQVKGGTGVTVT